VIPFVDLKAQYLSIKPEVDAAVLNVFENTSFVLGPAVVGFEKSFAAYCKAEQAIGTSTGTSALHLALLAAGIGPGDEVITTPFTFVATVSAIDYAGAKPVFVDITPETYTIDPSKIEAAITPRTKALLPVHLHGRPADMDPILDIAKRKKLVVIEDACQAHGAEYKGRRAGSMGDAGCFSFYPGKKPRRVRRRWRGDHQPFGPREEGSTLARLGRREEVPPRSQGLQLPARRRAGRRARREDEVHRGLDRGPPAPRRALHTKLLEGTPYGLPSAPSDMRHVYHVYAVRHPEATRSRRS